MRQWLLIPMRAWNGLKPARQWWVAELKAMLPWIEKILTDPQSRVLVRAGRKRTTLFLQDADVAAGREEIIDAPLESLSGSQREYLLNQCAHREITLSIDDSAVYCLSLRVPNVSLRNFRETVKYQLLTESPISADSMVFDVRRIDGARKSGAPMAEVALCRRNALEQLKAQAEQIGLEPLRIGLSRNRGVDLEFEFERRPGARTTASRLRSNALFASGPIFIFLLAPMVIWAYSEWQGDIMRKEIDSLSSRSDESVRLFARQAHTKAVRNAIVADMPNRSLTQILNEVSKTLPKSAWLSEMRLEEGRLRLIGNGSDPPAIARSLSATEGLFGVRLDSAASNATGSGLPRFEITAELAAKGSK